MGTEIPYEAETLSTGEMVRALNGVSYRMLDYWARNGVLEPEYASCEGPGSRRRYSMRQVRVARLIAAVNALGAKVDVLRAIARQAEQMPTSWWSGVVVIGPDGDLRGFDEVGGGGYIVDVVGCAAPVHLAQPSILASA